MTKGNIAKPVTQKLRCAIYTRKSSEEGLEMEFNSLDAQRDACSAYIASQRSEGWLELAGHYDDGGISGGTLERPALKRLLADIEEDRVDVVVVLMTPLIFDSCITMPKQARLSWTPLFVSGWVT